MFDRLSNPAYKRSWREKFRARTLDSQKRTHETGEALATEDVMIFDRFAARCARHGDIRLASA